MWRPVGYRHGKRGLRKNQDRQMPKERAGTHIHQYGRRVEIDRSWTVYHVFTGVVANSCFGATTGLSKVDATDRMMSLNSVSF
jgi:hypothetical protein